jgi:hypothetical protein
MCNVQRPVCHLCDSGRRPEVTSSASPLVHDVSFAFCILRALTSRPRRCGHTAFGTGSSYTQCEQVEEQSSAPRSLLHGRRTLLQSRTALRAACPEQPESRDTWPTSRFTCSVIFDYFTATTIIVAVATVRNQARHVGEAQCWIVRPS